MWQAIIAKLKGVLDKMLGSKTIERELHIAPVISSQMEIAIGQWSQMYKNKAPWLHEPNNDNPVRIVSLGLPAMIASEKARTALIEFNSEITTPTEEFEVENPDYEEPQPDEFGNIIPSTQKPTITEEKPVGDTSRAEYLEEQYKKLKKQLRKQIEYGIAKGGLVIKPYPVFQEAFNPNQDNNAGTQEETPKEDNVNENPQENQIDNEIKQNDTKQDTKNGVTPDGKEQEAPKAQYTIEFDFIQADCFYPLAFNNAGEITEAAFLDVKVEKDYIFRRLEYHKWEKSTLTIINKAYKAQNNTQNQNGATVDLGKEIKLTEVSEWASLQDKTVVAPVSKPLFAYFKMPEANAIDTTSPLGVSGFARAVDLIKDADMQYSRILWEYEAGEMAIDIDRDALNFVTGGINRDGSPGQGHSELGRTQQRLFRKVDLGVEGDTYTVFAPALRDASLINGLNNILMRIEDTTGLSRGTLSDVAAEARTATELKILKQRSYQTNADIQQAIEDALRDVIYAMNVYCDLYEITPDGDYDVNFEWDDSIIVDVDMELNKRMTLLSNGLMSKLELRMWYFGETERQAQDALLKVQEDSRQQMEDDLTTQGNLNNMQMGGNNPFEKKNNKDKKDNKEVNNHDMGYR